MSVRHSLRLAAIAALGMVTTTALAQDPAERSGLYLAISGGYTIPSTPDVESEDIGATFELELDNGFDGAAALGAYAGLFRFELEGAYRQNDFEDGQTGPLGLSEIEGNVHSASVMVNALFDIPLGDRVQIYLGGGVGMAWVEGALDAGFENVPEIADKEDDWVFAYQFMAGIAFDLSENVTLTTGYRLWTTEDAEFDRITLDAPLFHTVEVGLRFSF